MRFKAAKDYFRLVSEAVFSTEANDMSMLHFLFYLKSGGGIESFLNTDEGAQEDRIKGGTQQISIKLAVRLGKDVILNCPVHRIEQSENSIKIYSGTQVWEGKKGIVALPPTLAGRISYNLPLPGARDQLTQIIPAGSVIKIQVVNESPFWRKRDLNGQVASFTGPVKVVLDNSLHNDSRGVLVMFMEANKGRQASEWTAKEREAKTIDSLVNFFC